MYLIQIRIANLGCIVNKKISFKKMVVGVGFEPTYAMRADLQSAAFNHSATPPL